jgi:membrane-associated phospholipid phosphatase
MRTALRVLLCCALVVAAAGPAFPQGAERARPELPSMPWRPWFLDSVDQFRLEAPPGPASTRTRRELRALLRLQSKRTARVERQVRFWNSGPGTVRWTRVALKMIVRHRPAAFPTRTARGLALLHLGMYDALAAAADSRAAYRRARPHRIEPRIKSLIGVSGSSYPDSRAAIAGAAERILAYLFPQEAPETFEALADAATKSRLWAGVNYRSDVWRARNLGRAVADVVIAAAESDGYQSPWDFEEERPCSTHDCGADPACGSSGGDEGFWIPTPPACQYPPTDPMASKWVTYLLERPDQFRPPPPPAYGSEQFMNELEDVKERSDSATQEERELAFFWDDGPGTYSPAGHWNDIAVDLVKNRELSTAATARLFALMNAAIRDAFVAAWDAKYHYWSIRPVTVIRERPTILGAPNPVYDPGWLPNLVTPPFPAYPSGHTAESAAAARVLQYLLPDSGPRDPNIKDELGPAGSIDLIAEEVALSRMLGGIHFTADNEAALAIGRRLAALAIGRAEAEEAR